MRVLATEQRCSVYSFLSNLAQQIATRCDELVQYFLAVTALVASRRRRSRWWLCAFSKTDLGVEGARARPRHRRTFWSYSEAQEFDTVF
jgi:hypothetical protein